MSKVEPTSRTMFGDMKNIFWHIFSCAKHRWGVLKHVHKRGNLTGNEEKMEKFEQGQKLTKIDPPSKAMFRCMKIVFWHIFSCAMLGKNLHWWASKRGEKPGKQRKIVSLPNLTNVEPTSRGMLRVKKITFWHVFSCVMRWGSVLKHVHKRGEKTLRKRLSTSSCIEATNGSRMLKKHWSSKGKWARLECKRC